MTTQEVERIGEEEHQFDHAVYALSGTLLLAQSRTGVVDPDRIRWDIVKETFPQYKTPIESLRGVYDYVRETLGNDPRVYFDRLGLYASHFEEVPESHAKNCLTILLVNQASVQHISLSDSRKLRKLANGILEAFKITGDGTVVEDGGEAGDVNMRYLARKFLQEGVSFTIRL